MRIGQVSRGYNISTDSIYFYINYGLLVPPLHNRQYVFDDATLRDLETVLELKSMDFSLDEIHRILSLRRVSNLGSTQDMDDLKKLFLKKRDNCAAEALRYEEIVQRLNEKIANLSLLSAPAVRARGVPVRMLDLLCCPVCGASLRAKEVEMEGSDIFHGHFGCCCGYSAVIEDGILITPNENRNVQDRPDVERELYKDLPPRLISLFQRSYNLMTTAIRGLPQAERVTLECYVNAWFFMHNHLQYLDPRGRYIVVDKYPETLRMYKSLIERQGYALDFLFIADSSTDWPLKKSCVDLNIDFFAVNEHNFYHESFLHSELLKFYKTDVRLLGTYFYFENGKKSMEMLLSQYPECSANNFSLNWFLARMKECGVEFDFREDCGFTTDSGDNLGFSFHAKGEKMHLMPYEAHFARLSEHADGLRLRPHPA